MKTITVNWFVIALAIAALATPNLAHAGSVEAVAGTTIDSQTGVTAIVASASEASFFATTTRQAGLSSGAIDNFVLALETSAATETTSAFTVFGLASATPLTFNWTFTGNRVLATDNAFFGANLRADLNGPSGVNAIIWGLSYGEAFGSVAGTLLAAPLVSAAGTGITNSLFGAWNGLGSVQASSTLLDGITGLAGSFGLATRTGMSGDVFADYRLSLDTVTVPFGTDVSEAFLLLDTGNTILIVSAPAAVPEPGLLGAFALACGALAMVRRRVDTMRSGTAVTLFR